MNYTYASQRPWQLHVCIPQTLAPLDAKNQKKKVGNARCTFALATSWRKFRDCGIHSYIHRCMHTYMHTYIHNYVHTYKLYTHTATHTPAINMSGCCFNQTSQTMCKFSKTANIYLHTHTDTHTRAHTHTHIHPHACAQRTHIHTRNTHTYIHTQTHTHT